MPNPAILLLALAAGLLLPHCGSDDDTADDSSPSAGDTPIGTEWTLVRGELDDQAISPVDGNPITLSFTDDGQVVGSSGCNSYFGGGQPSDGAVTISEIGVTEMACLEPGVMDVEQTYLDALLRVTAYTTTEDTLTLTGEGVRLDYGAVPPEEPAAIEGTVWRLETVVEGEAAVGLPDAGDFTFVVEPDGRAHGSGACNDWSGGITVQGDELSNTGQLAITEEACSADLTEQDRRVYGVLGDVTTLTHEARTLTLETGDGRALVFRAE